MTLHEFVQQCINGLSLGSTYALLALGLAMLFSIMGLINFAHGDQRVHGAEADGVDQRLQHGGAYLPK